MEHVHPAPFHMRCPLSAATPFPRRAKGVSASIGAINYLLSSKSHQFLLPMVASPDQPCVDGGAANDITQARTPLASQMTKPMGLLRFLF